jgi:ABC-type dipeptide/oligopeptide/nickel transport system permease component
MGRPGRSLLRVAGLVVFVWLVIVFTSFLLLKLGAAPPAVLLGGPNMLPEDQARLAAEYGLNQVAPVQFIRYAIRTLGGDFGQSWLTGDPIGRELLQRLPATLELMIYGVLLGGLIGVPFGVTAAFNRGGAEDRTVRGAGILGEAMPAFLLGLMLLLVFFRWLDVAPAPSGRISVVLSPPTTVTGSYFIDSILMQDSIAARSALAQLLLPVTTLALLVAASLALEVRSAVLAQLQTAHFAYARAQGMSREMLTSIALRGAAPTIWAAVTGQFSVLLGTTAVVEYVFAWGGLGQYGLDAMAKADFAAVQGFVLMSGLISLVVYAVHGLVRRAARLRFTRA